LNLKCDFLVSKFAFKFNLYRYSVQSQMQALKCLVEPPRLTYPEDQLLALQGGAGGGQRLSSSSVTSARATASDEENKVERQWWEEAVYEMKAEEHVGEMQKARDARVVGAVHVAFNWP
jgi:hypothetical protein